MPRISALAELHQNNDRAAECEFVVHAMMFHLAQRPADLFKLLYGPREVIWLCMRSLIATGFIGTLGPGYYFLTAKGEAAARAVERRFAAEERAAREAAATPAPDSPSAA